MKQSVNVMLRLPHDEHKWLVSQAAKNTRSMNNQMIVLIKEAMKQTATQPEILEDERKVATTLEKAV